ncbi:MAG TPA: ABC transporter ATP-binding protein [Planctomycetota bacterium]|nr:ABC transporter ATP-binding protein [Planctomycetota bacterium]
MSLTITDLRVTYGNVRALDGVSVTLEPGEMFFLLGPSGCGKSTLLRSVAGFIEDFDGDIGIGSESLKGVPPHKRDFGMVFQNYALFPHLTVNGNVAFGLDARNVPSAEKATRVAEALKMVGLEGYGERRPGELSGGQQQRVALARALVIRPRVLLLDEPLSNLDARLRWEMREEIRRIHRQTKITTLYVTHDQSEALSLADRMAILRAGKIEALGPPRELYRYPPNRFSADFLGDVNAVKCTLAADGKSAVTELGTVELHTDTLPPGVAPGKEATVFCRPESVAILENETSQPQAGFQMLSSTARVVSGAFLGQSTLYELELPGQLRWRVLRHETGGQGVPDGAQVRLAVAPKAWSMVAL